jgi:hypothetical protein
MSVERGLCALFERQLALAGVHHYARRARNAKRMYSVSTVLECELIASPEVDDPLRWTEKTEEPSEIVAPYTDGNRSGRDSSAIKWVDPFLMDDHGPAAIFSQSPSQ